MGAELKMVRRKKAEGLSLQAVAIGAIILVVLIVVLAIFKGGIDKIVPTLGKINECPEPKIVNCVATDDRCAGEKIYGLGCEKPDKDGKPSEKLYCCVKQNA